MPSTERKKGRSKEDTWGAPELTNKLKDAHTDRKKRSSGRVKHKESEEQARESTEKRDSEKKSSDRTPKDQRDGSRDRNRREEKNRDGKHKDQESREKHRKDDSRERERRKEQDGKRRSSHREKETSGEEKKERRGERKEDGHRRERTRTEEDKEGRRGHDKEGRSGHDRERHKEGRDKEKGMRETEEERRQRKKEKREKEKYLEEDLKRKETTDNRHDDKRKHRDRNSEKSHREKEERRPKRRDENGHSERDKRTKDEEYEEERKRRKEEKRRLKEAEESRNMREQQEARKESQVEVLKPDGDPGANGYDYDDEDFEDYDDDFEDEDAGGEEAEETGEGSSKTETDFDDSAVAELQQAMEAENRLSSADSPVEKSRGGISKDSAGRGTKKTTFINFVAAKQRQISNTVAERTRKRGEVLTKLIELDAVTFDLFDMPPVKDYERFIKYYGRSDTTQAAVQCNDDNLDRDIQTEEIEHQEKWCQHPAEGTHCCGGDGVDEEFDIPINQEAHSLRLSQFLESAGQVMAVLLEESRADEDGGSQYSNQTNLVFSEGYTQLKADIPSTKGCAIVSAEVHPVQTHLILAAYGGNGLGEDSARSERGILCVWNVNDPSQPQKILTCRSQPSCCLWSPSKATMAFAGTVDGSIMVWDLREPSGMHTHRTIDGGTRPVRVPTFSTDGIMREEAHKSRVVSLLPIVTLQDNRQASMPGEQSMGSDVTFQLASLEEKGVINFWVVLEISRTSQAGSESELAVIPGGRVKLVWSSTICLNVPGRDPSLSADFKALCFKLDPQVPSQFYVGTDGGIVLHASRHGGKVYPKSYRDRFAVPVEVTHLDFSPFGLSCFLVGCSDGSIRLHSTASEFPLLSWPDSTMGSGISSIAWSQSRPSVFYSADTRSRVFVWSLLERDGNPIKEEQLSSGRLTALIASHDYSASSMGRPGRHPELVIANEEGSIEVHRLNEHFTSASGDELDSMAALLESFT